MSVISEKVAAALYSKLNVSGVTNLVTGIHEGDAPDDAELPYVIFRRQAPGAVTRSLGSLVLEDDIWLVKAVTDEDSDTSKSPAGFAEEIATACETAIGESLTLTGNTVAWCKRQNDMPPYQEPLGDRTIYHRGFLLRIATE
jgi:hypothetical protein